MLPQGKSEFLPFSNLKQWHEDIHDRHTSYDEIHTIVKHLNSSEWLVGGIEYD